MNFIRKIIFQSFTLYLLSIWISGLRVHGGLTTFLLAGLVLTICSFILKPIINFVTTPFAAISLGLSRVLDNALILFFLTKIIPQVAIVPFSLARFEFMGFVIPRLDFGYFLAFIAIACIKSLLQAIMVWITR